MEVKYLIFKKFSPCEVCSIFPCPCMQADNRGPNKYLTIIYGASACINRGLGCACMWGWCLAVGVAARWGQLVLELSSVLSAAESVVTKVCVCSSSARRTRMVVT